ncbi:MAG: ABC transporter ATP-binding protein, partial [Dehalococcoidia bacterium]|nr:ABC transporter ATP-binding protein [Dehalococcoidia bacterium]
REQVREEVIALLREAGVATMLVTHDAEEAMAVSDRIALLDDGAIVQVAPPRELYQSPVDRRAAAALGRVNVIPAETRDGIVHSVVGAWPLARPNGPVELLIRPECLRVAPTDTEPCWRVATLRFQGPLSLAWLTSETRLPLIAVAPDWLAVGDRVRVTASPDRAVVVSAPASSDTAAC